MKHTNTKETSTMSHPLITEDGEKVRPHSGFIQISFCVEGDRFANETPSHVEVFVKVSARYKYYAGCPATHDDPGDEPEISCESIAGIEFFVDGFKWLLPEDSSMYASIYDWSQEQLDTAGTSVNDILVAEVTKLITQ